MKNWSVHLDRFEKKKEKIERDYFKKQSELEIEAKILEEDMIESITGKIIVIRERLIKKHIFSDGNTLIKTIQIPFFVPSDRLHGSRWCVCKWEVFFGKDNEIFFEIYLFTRSERNKLPVYLNFKAKKWPFEKNGQISDKGLEFLFEECLKVKKLKGQLKHEHLSYQHNQRNEELGIPY